MASIGYTTPGSHQDNNLPGSILLNGYFTTDASGGTVQDAQCYFDSITSTGTRSQAGRIVIFSDSSNTPTTTVVGVTDEVVVSDLTTPATWISLPSWTNFGGPPTLTALTKYWVGLWWGTQTGGDSRWQVAWDFAILPVNARFASGITYSSTTNPVVSSWTDTGSSAGDSWYVNYAPSVSVAPFPGIPMQSSGRF